MYAWIGLTGISFSEYQTQVKKSCCLYKNALIFPCWRYQHDNVPDTSEWRPCVSTSVVILVQVEFHTRIGTRNYGGLSHPPASTDHRDIGTRASKFAAM